jgi:ATP/maltotriose-dependent transcriptional regulator MalT
LIASSLNVSVNTVKWHLKNLYGKLGVSNRFGALTQARERDLLS